MRAVLCKELGGTDKLALSDIPSPAIRPGTVRIAVEAAGVNFADTLIIEGKYQEKPALPFSPGMEIAGIVAELGPGSTGVKVGDRVLAYVGYGGFAEEVIVPVEGVVKLPDRMDFATAAGFPVAYGTSHISLDYRAHLKKGDTLLVLGASGGVGLTAVEIGKVLGATVIAVAGGEEKAEIARRQGADHVIDHSKEDLRERVKALTGDRGVDVVYDPVGGDMFDASLRCVAWEGRMIVIGFASGKVPQIPANYLLVKNFDVIGFHWGAYRTRDPATMSRSLAQLLAWYDEGKLKPHVSHQLPLAEAGQAIDLLRSRKATGKVVVLTRR